MEAVQQRDGAAMRPLSTFPSSTILRSSSISEEARLKKRRRMARKTPEQRQRKVMYVRRHNEKDGVLYYCDYCDRFVSTSQVAWKRHLQSPAHIHHMESYYQLVDAYATDSCRDENDGGDDVFDVLERELKDVWDEGQQQSGGGSGIQGSWQ